MISPSLVIVLHSNIHCSLCRTYQTKYVSESDETWQICLPQWAKHAPSSSARLDAAVAGEIVDAGTLTGTYQTEYVSESDETWQTYLYKWATLAPSSSARLGAAVSGESVDECTLTGPYRLRYPIIGALCRTYQPMYVSESDETWQTYVPQWATHAPSSSARRGTAALTYMVFLHIRKPLRDILTYLRISFKNFHSFTYIF
ncbi:hypothetical protein DPMN_151956 [Dreissena polymorpha]|uniref:Uncharacterized protein n=1 Tax=Dreissena polymorpha TaxID=45954 RepID=A0A9D4FHF9_DREPO|nr:hypothetical protein DPMN_151956 [Dreissena polymorpha]